MATTLQKPETTDASDRELLAKFVANGEEVSFAALVHRYSGLVMGVCRRTTRDSHYAEDAFQATFLVLAKNARKVRDPDALSSWLHGVAFRVSLRVNRQLARQSSCEVSDEDMSIVDDPFEQLSTKFANQKTDEELNRLPEHLRTPMILRYTMGKSNAQIANQLGLSVAAVEGRLKRAKSTLRVRLTRYGISVGVVTAAIAMTRESHAAVPARLIESTITNSLTFRSSGGASLQPAARQAAKLAREEAIAMSVLTGSKVSIVVCSAAVILAGFGLRPLGNTANGGDRGTAVVSNQKNEIQSDAAFQLAQADDPFGGDPVVTPVRSEATNGGATKSTETPTSRFFDVKKRTANEIRIAEELNKPTRIELFDMTLQDTMDYLQELHEIQFVIDHIALEDAAMDGSTAVRDLTLSGIRLCDVLDLILDSVALDWMPTKGVILITSKGRAGYIENRVYPIPKEWKVAPDEMIEIIQKTIAPVTWEEVGGEGSIVATRNSLVIHQSYRAHEAITELFTQLDASNQQAKE